MYEGLNFSKGQKFKIRVPITGLPFPSVTWSKDGNVITPGERYEVSVTETSAMLVVNEVERCDMGQYNITVENDLGADSASFTVNVYGKCLTPSWGLYIYI